jgi:hypothetical protein
VVENGNLGVLLGMELAVDIDLEGFFAHGQEVRTRYLGRWIRESKRFGS